MKKHVIPTLFVPVLALLLAVRSVVAGITAPVFSGSASYVALGAPDSLHMPEDAPFTIEGWMNLNGISSRDMMYSRRAGRGSGDFTYMFGFIDGNTMSAYIGHGGSPNTVWRDVALDPVLETNRWYHLAYRFDGETLSYYLDGELVGTQSFRYSDHPGYQVMIGGYDNLSDINGLKSDIRVWDHARSPEQIQRHRQRRLVGTEYGLLGYWRLDEGGGSTVHDGSGYDSDGALVGATWAETDTLSLETFAVVNPVTGDVNLTGTNIVDVAIFPWYDGYDQYQIAENGQAPAAGAWISTNPSPATCEFSLPPTDTNVLLTAWFRDQAETLPVLSNTAEIVYTTVAPTASVKSITRHLVEGSTTVTIGFEDIDDGTTWGVYDGMDLTFGYGLSCEQDITATEPYVTLDAVGGYDLILTVTNRAGNTAVTTSVVTVVNRTDPYLYVALAGDDSGASNWAGAYTHPAKAISQAISGDTLLFAGDTFVLDAPLDLDLTNLTLSGGYAATNEVGVPGEYDIQRWRTVLTRDAEAGRVRLIEISANDVTVERLELRDGSADGPGGGVHAANVNGLEIRHCRFINNTCYETWGTEGGGLSLVNVQGSVNHSLFKGNSSTRWHSTYQATAGSMAIRGGTIAMYDIVLVGDHGATHPHTGSGIWISGGQHGLTNILAVFLGRQNADQGSGIHIVAGSQVEIANATVYGNYGDGIRNLAGVNTVIRDSIIYGNTHPLSGGKRDIINGTDGSGTPAILYNNIIGDGGGAGMNGNLDVDPRFAYPLFYLASDSPALDSGSRTVADAGLTNWTSRIDGATYAGTVNRGYHFAEGLGIDLELYVSPGGNDGNDGSGPGAADALRTITRALAIAGEHERLEPRVRLHVAAGDYTTGDGEVFPLAVQGMTFQIMGTNAAATVIDAGGSATGNQRVFTLTESLGDNRIEGVTLTGGYISGITARGIGVYADKSLLTVASSILRDNIHVGTQYGIGYGAGLYAVESGVMIRDSEIRDNRVSGSNVPRGGGVSVERGRTILANVIMSGNESRNTHATWGGSRAGGLNVFGVVVLRNTLMTGNKATVRGRTGNAIYMQGGDLIIENVTIVTNINDISSGVAIHRAAGTVTLRNTILWDNVGDFNVTNTINIAYCLSTELDDGVNNNLIADPLFIDAAAGDFRLTALASGVPPSPAVDAGINLWWMAGAVDLDGQPRILRGLPANATSTVDMGAYEAAPPPGSMLIFR